MALHASWIARAIWQFNGSAKALHGAVIVISGVLDSMGRKEMEEYVVAHGGIVRKAITKATTHLVNDHGSVGPSKLKKCKAQGVPVVSEDDIFSLVAKSLIPEKSTSIWFHNGYSNVWNNNCLHCKIKYHWILFLPFYVNIR